MVRATLQAHAAALVAGIHNPDAALRRAVMRLDAVAAKAALEHGADPNTRILFGRVKSSSARSKGWKSSLMFDADAGSNKFATFEASPSNRLPLLHVAAKRVGETMSYTDAHVSVARQRKGRVAFTEFIPVALVLPIVKLLLQYEVDVDAVDRSGNTALHEAARTEGCEEVVRLLLEAQADHHQTNDAGETPWDISRKEQNGLAMALLHHTIAEQNKFNQSIDAMRSVAARAIAVDTGGNFLSEGQEAVFAVESASEKFKMLISPTHRAERLIAVEKLKEATDLQKAGDNLKAEECNQMNAVAMEENELLWLERAAGSLPAGSEKLSPGIDPEPVIGAKDVSDSEEVVTWAQAELDAEQAG